MSSQLKWRRAPWEPTIKRHRERSGRLTMDLGWPAPPAGSRLPPDEDDEGE
jgi:hypothetical protein